MSLRTDLAIESHQNYMGEGVRVKEEQRGSVSITTVYVETEAAAQRLSKPVGEYITIKAENILYDTTEYTEAVNMIAQAISSFAPTAGNVLVAGLGNRSITPDALGPETVSRVFVTKHIKKHGGYDFAEKLGSVSAIAPGVLGTTGIETAEILRGVVGENKPDLVIAVDAFAAGDVKNMASTVQVSNTGLIPGGGTRNRRNAVNKDSLGVPVIAIGVPTVVDAQTLSQGRWEGEPYFITPKDIDLVIDRMSKTIANGINTAVHKNLTIEEIESFIG